MVTIYLFPHLTAYSDLLAWLNLHHHCLVVSLISLAYGNSATVSPSAHLVCVQEKFMQRGKMLSLVIIHKKHTL